MDGFSGCRQGVDLMRSGDVCLMSPDPTEGHVRQATYSADFS